MVHRMTFPVVSIFFDCAYPGGAARQNAPTHKFTKGMKIRAAHHPLLPIFLRRDTVSIQIDISINPLIELTNLGSAEKMVCRISPVVTRPTQMQKNTSLPIPGCGTEIACPLVARGACDDFPASEGKISASGAHCSIPSFQARVD